MKASDIMIKQSECCLKVTLFCLAILIWVPGSMPVKAESSQELYDNWANLYAGCQRQEDPVLDIWLLSKANFDECFYDVGDSRNQYLAAECDDGTWKVNGGQVWGLTVSGEKLWLGTRENPLCTTMGGAGQTDPVLTDYAVCEFGEGPFSGDIPDEFGDWRPPSIFVYNLDTDEMTQKAFLEPGTMGGLPLIHGLRGAGSVDGIVFLAGLSGVDEESAKVILFAYNSETEEFLGWHELLDPDGKPYRNTRKWLSFKGYLYGCLWVDNGGRILRWLGDADAIKGGDLATLWEFEEVGRLDQSPSNIAVYEGNRLAVGTRPVGSKRVLRGGEIWFSPVFDNYLSAADAGNWEIVWSTALYDPDFVTGVASAIGDLRFFDGYLWWGTESLPGQAQGIHNFFYSKLIDSYPDAEQDLAAFYGTWRPTSIFRGRKFDTAEPEIDLLYGFKYLPRFVFNFRKKTGEWRLAPNRMGGKSPLWGTGGLCNWFQVQTYSMEVFHDQLFVGTNEYSHRFMQGLLPVSIYPTPQPPNQSLWGAELWRFPDSDSPAAAESISGLGNYLNTAVRNMITDGSALYIGTGNTNNLATDLFDEVPEGGWELLELKLPPL